MKGATNGFGEAGIDGNDEKGGEELASFKDNGFATGEFVDVRGFALPFAPMRQAIAFPERSEKHEWKEISDEDVKDAAPGIGDVFPGSDGGKDQEQSVKHVGKETVNHRRGGRGIQIERESTSGNKSMNGFNIK